MKFILEDTDIYDPDIAEKVQEILKTELPDMLEQEVAYRFAVIYHVNLNYDEREFSFYEKYVEPTQSHSRKKEEYTISEVLSYQLKKIEQVLLEYKILLPEGKIAGRVLEKETMIELELEKIPEYDLKEKREFKVRSIMGDEEKTWAKATEVVNHFYNGQFSRLVQATNDDRELLSEIMGIKQTEDLGILFQAYVKLYGSLFDTKEEHQKKIIKMKKRVQEICKERGIEWDSNEKK
ncbi:MAG: hypothetical protein PHG16_07180 [Lachnospiraceae bacterium]|nr:hypothetical protein [Lachnospiraceae bacterium]